MNILLGLNLSDCSMHSYASLYCCTYLVIITSVIIPMLNLMNDVYIQGVLTVHKIFQSKAKQNNKTNA